MHYNRNLSELKNIKKNGYKVFSCFSCGGGSTMGYKYAGYDVIGTCEIDPQMDKVYRHNHGDRYNFLMGVQELKNIPNDQLSKELFNLDILDGSPPCSTFSTAGSREKARGKNKVFREGQAKQVLSDLFFDFLDLAEKLKPKIIIAENVSGMLKGNAKGYVKMILEKLDKMGYKTQLFLLNGATMGLPQTRERVFFISHKKELDYQKLQLNFNEKNITYKEIEDKEPIKGTYKGIGKKCTKLREICQPGYSFSTVHPKGSYFNHFKVHPNKVLGTITASGGNKIYHYKDKRCLSTNEYRLASSFPGDYNYLDTVPYYLMGMSVPPLMMYKISNEIQKQWLSKI